MVKVELSFEQIRYLLECMYLSDLSLDMNQPNPYPYDSDLDKLFTHILDTNKGDE